jgi:hypothetical protein
VDRTLTVMAAGQPREAFWHGPRWRTLLVGCALALAAGLLVEFGGHLGAEVPAVALLGAAFGGVLALVPVGSTVGRGAAFLVGFVLGLGGYAARAGFLPDIPLGDAIATFLVVLLVAVVCALSADRLPLWAGLLGVGAIAGAYETTFELSPTTFRSDSLTAATASLLAAAAGFAVCAVLADWLAKPVTAGSRPELSRPELSQPEPPQPELSQPEPLRPELSQPEPLRPELSQPEPLRPELSQPEPLRPELSQPEPLRPEPSQPGLSQPEPQTLRLPLPEVRPEMPQIPDARPGSDVTPPEAFVAGDPEEQS